MPPAVTPTRQRTEIGEGLAVGCLVAGVTGISTAAPLDAALQQALAGWSWAARYPTVGRSPRVADTLRASAGRRGLKIAQWVSSRGLAVPQLRDDDWDLPAACVRLEDATAVPARRWLDLSRDVLAGLPDETVWRAPDVTAIDEDTLPAH